MVSHQRPKGIAAERLALKRGEAACAGSRLGGRSAGGAVRSEAVISNTVRHERSSARTERSAAFQKADASATSGSIHKVFLYFFFLPVEILMAPLKSSNWMLLYQVTNYL